jgi:excisionase family DNA binding protein
MQDTGPDERSEAMTVADAAERLGISKEAVRKRISRGTLRADKDRDGAVRVYVPPSDTPSATAAAPELVEELRDQVRYLRDQLDQEREANSENRRIIAALTARIPELPGTPQASPEATSQEPSEFPQTATEQPGRVGPQTEVEGPQEGTQRVSWWRRVFGG